MNQTINTRSVREHLQASDRIHDFQESDYRSYDGKRPVSASTVKRIEIDSNKFQALSPNLYNKLDQYCLQGKEVEFSATEKQKLKALGIEFSGPNDSLSTHELSALRFAFLHKPPNWIRTLK